jgi:hypothetical protein
MVVAPQVKDNQASRPLQAMVISATFGNSGAGYDSFTQVGEGLSAGKFDAGSRRVRHRAKSG